VLSPLELGEKYGLEALRYFLLREMAFGLDANFSEEALVTRLNADLANNLGNLLQRSLAMVERFLGGEIPPPGDSRTDADLGLQAGFRTDESGIAQQVRGAMEEFAFHRALEAIWQRLDSVNQYIDSQKPWELAKKDPAAIPRVLGHACEALRLIGLHLYPFMPATAEKIWTRLGIADRLAEARLAEAGEWGGGSARRAVRGEALFPRVEAASVETPAAVAPPPQAAPPSTATSEVGIDEFRRLDLRVAEILHAKAVRGSKKLVHLTVSLGGEERSVVAGILLDYPPESLVGKQIVVVANLQPTTLMGVESRGMLLAATDAEGKLVLVSPERRATPGSKVK
jgi:methionyl-tRNA synthetase